MSIIERVAELLGPLTRPNAESTTPGKGESKTALDLVERAVGGGIERSELPEARKFTVQEPQARSLAAESKAMYKPRPVGTTTPTYRIDLDRLRGQSITTPQGGRTLITESFRRIKRPILTNVANPRPGTPANLVMVTSALPGEGKTFCAINLAISIASEMDRTVLLVDGDVARPSVMRVLGLEAGKGLLDVLLDPRVALAEVLCKTSIDKLTLLPAGTAQPHATELLASDGMHVLLREMAARYEDRIVIFDSPPLLEASESGVLANQMGQIVMVVEAGKTTEAALKSAMDRIESRNVAGVVLNKWEGHNLGYTYGTYGYGAK
jgi:receptor protein-tyrosine kinase